MTSIDTFEQVAASAAISASYSGILAFLAAGPMVSPEIFLSASAIGGIAGGFLSTLNEPGELKLRSLIVIMGHGALLGPAIVALSLWTVGIPPTLPAVSIASGLGGTLSWSVSKHFSKQIPGILRALVAHFVGGQK